MSPCIFLSLSGEIVLPFSIFRALPPFPLPFSALLYNLYMSWVSQEETSQILSSLFLVIPSVPSFGEFFLQVHRCLRPGLPYPTSQDIQLTAAFLPQSYNPPCTPSLVPGARLQILADTASTLCHLSYTPSIFPTCLLPLSTYRIHSPIGYFLEWLLPWLLMQPTYIT